MEKPQCQCEHAGVVEPALEPLYDPEEKAGMNHAPGHCQGTFDLALYDVGGGHQLWLCSCCHLSAHKRIRTWTPEVITKKSIKEVEDGNADTKR